MNTNRSATIKRETRETRITVELDLDGQGRYQLLVELVDERLSSIEADEIISEARRHGGISKGKAKRALDQVAAELIIQTCWLELHSSSTSESLTKSLMASERLV